MICKQCGARWRLSQGLGGGGSPSPGEHLVISTALLVLAVVLGHFVDPLPAIICAVVGLLVLVMGLCDCGHRADMGVNRGSRCDRCGTENCIWPWNF